MVIGVFVNGSQNTSNVKALSVLHSKYESDRRLEEAAMVRRIIDRIWSEANSNEGFYDET
jgi:hypothetical protein